MNETLEQVLTQYVRNKIIEAINIDSSKLKITYKSSSYKIICNFMLNNVRNKIILYLTPEKGIEI